MYEREKEITERLYDEVIETARYLTSIDRGSKSLRGLDQTAHYLGGRLEEMGCEVTYHGDPEYGNTVVGRKRGKGKIKVMFYAHMDTVWPEGTAEKNPFRIEDGMAYGAGVSDCTHGILGSLYTLRVLNELGFEDYGELLFVFNPDEELTSPSSTKWLKHYSQDMDVAFCMEGPEGADTFTTSRAGSAYYEINIKGKMAHAGVNPEEGANALVEMTRKLNDILAREFPNVYLVVCWIKGGSGDCCVSDNAYAMLRYRIYNWDPKDEIDTFLKQVEAVTYVPGTTTSITFWPEGGFGPMPKLPWVEPLVELVCKTSTEMGNPLREACSGGGADSASTVLNCPTLDGLAPASYACHSPEERLQLDTIVPRISLMVVLLEKISSDDKYLRERA